MGENFGSCDMGVEIVIWNNRIKWCNDDHDDGISLTNRDDQNDLEIVRWWSIMMGFDGIG